MDTIRVDPAPRYELSPWLYMQFMEPLGVTDSSVEAAWDHPHGRWHEFVVEETRKLAPGLMRWGGILSSYYRWREAVGDRAARRPMLNLMWGGVETNQVGTAEFCEFCEAVGADKLFCVNFLSDGVERWRRTPAGEDRTGDAAEAAAWVAYCNDPDNAERRAHGRLNPYGVRLWQIGNETSYYTPGFTAEEAAAHTAAFARAMRRADPAVQLIGWGDSGWARTMAEAAGEHLDYIAFHYHVGPDAGVPLDALRYNDYRLDWDRTWEQLMGAWQGLQAVIDEKRGELAGYGLKLAMTEGHFALPGRNRCEVLSTWAAGVANARALNIQERNADILKIATLADFCGTRWMVNSLYIEHPAQRAYRMPVAHVTGLYRRHVGTAGLHAQAPAGLDVAASRTGDTVYLHVVNTSMDKSRRVEFHVGECQAGGGRAYVLRQDPRWEIMADNAGELAVREEPFEGSAFTFPPASVTAVELRLSGPEPGLPDRP